jgi:hypothetical protein
MIGVEPFLFLHGYAPGPWDLTYLPKMLNVGDALAVRRELTPNGDLVVLESQSTHGNRQLSLDPARGFAAVRLEIRMDASHTAAGKLLTAFGLRERTSVIEADHWIVVDGIHIPTQLRSRDTYESVDGQIEKERTTQELSNIRVKRDFSGRNSFGFETAIPEETRVRVAGLDEFATTDLARDSHHQRLITALSPLDKNKFSRATTVDVASANLQIIDAARDELTQLAAEAELDWFLHPLLPALRQSLTDIEEETRRELGRMEGLTRLKGTSVPNAVLKTLDGNEIQLSEFIRGKVALLAFWGYT